jgi:SAM-dependent methyltransferase
MAQAINDSELSRIKSVYLGRDRSGCNGRYGIAERGNVLRVEELHRLMQSLIASHIGPDLSAMRILDIGCGSGYWLRQLVQWGARPSNLVGVDLLPERILKARELCPPDVRLECGDASHLNFDDGMFDLALQATVFGSILNPDLHEALASEIRRVLKPGGRLLWYDLGANNPWNREVCGLRRKEIIRLFPGCQVELKRVTLAPPLGRAVGRISPLAYQLLSSVRVLSTHYLGFIRKPCTMELPCKE